jgi:hypothetical protein
MEGGVVGHNFIRDPPKDHPVPARFSVIWFSGFRGEDFSGFFCEIFLSTDLY